MLKYIFVFQKLKTLPKFFMCNVLMKIFRKPIVIAISPENINRAIGFLAVFTVFLK